MLYSVELGSQYRVPWLLGCGSGGDGSSLFLLDPGFLAGQASQVEDTCTTYFTGFVEFNRVDERGVVRENTLDSDSVRHLADGERLGDTSTTFLDHDTAEFLDTLLAVTLGVVFLDLVSHGDGVLKSGYCFCSCASASQATFIKSIVS